MLGSVVKLKILLQAAFVCETRGKPWEGNLNYDSERKYRKLKTL